LRVGQSVVALSLIPSRSCSRCPVALCASSSWFSDRATQTWMDYPLHLPPHNDIIGAQFSPDRTHVALRVSDKEVKVLSTATGEVVTARSCRGTSSRMISVHWILDPSLTKHAAAASLFLLFVTNAGVELYELTSDKPLLSSALSASGGAGGAMSPALVKNKLKHIKTATYPIVYHWILLEENILLLVDSKNVFQAYKLSAKHISKICKFELDCAGTSLTPPATGAVFHREQIVLTWLYGRMVILFVNEAKGQLHLLSLAAPAHSDEMEQTHVFDLYQPGKYDVSVLDNVLVVHNSATRVSLLFDVRSESKTTIAEPLTIGPPLSNAANNGAAGGSGGALFSNAPSNSGGGAIHFFDPASLVDGSKGDARAAPGMASLAPASFHPYMRWTFLGPCYAWESTGDQQQGNLWTLHLNLQQIAFSWPQSKRARLVDFLLKRNSVQAKQLILQILLQIVCTEPASLVLLSRLFSLLNRMLYDHRTNPHAVPSPLVTLASLPLLPVFTAPNSLASTANNSTAASPASAVAAGQASIVRPASSHGQATVSPYANLPRAGAFGTGSPLAAGMLPSFGNRLTSPAGHRSTLSTSSTSATFAISPSVDAAGAPSSTAGSSATSAVSTPSAALPAASSSSLPSSHLGSAAVSPSMAMPHLIGGGVGPASYDLDDSVSVLSCEMLDHSALWATPLRVEHNLHGYMLLSPLDLYAHVFSRARSVVPPAQLIPAVVEYLRSTQRHFLKSDDLLNDLLVSLLLEDGRHYELHQYLQYHILNDSLPIANRLLLNAQVYPPAYQLGIDMLYRLGAVPRLIQVLLAHGQVLPALQLIPSYRAPLLDAPGSTPRDFLTVALQSGDDMLLYHTYRFFEARNVALRGSASFIVGDGCEQFVTAFHDKFAASLLAQAAQQAAIASPAAALAAASAGARGSIVVPVGSPAAAGALQGSSSFTASGAPAAFGGVPIPGLPFPMPQQFFNLGDEDDLDGEDGDIEYWGTKPDPYAPARRHSDGDSPPPSEATDKGAEEHSAPGGASTTTRSRSQSRSKTSRSRAASASGAAAAAADAGSSAAAAAAGEDGDAVDDVEDGLSRLRLPTPLDLRTQGIPSVGFSEDGAEDAAAECGLGSTLTKRERDHVRAQLAAMAQGAPSPDLPDAGIDGSFGGMSTPAAASSDASSRKNSGARKLSALFKATPAYQAEPAM